MTPIRTISLAALLLLLVAAVALPLTESSALQAVWDFEDDQNMQITYDESYNDGGGLIIGSTTFHDVICNDNDLRYYTVADAGYVALATRLDLSGDENPALKLSAVLTEAQAIAAAQAFAEDHYPNFTTVSWNTTQNNITSSQIKFEWEEQLPNGCLTSRAVTLTLDLTTGEVIEWSRLDRTAPSVAFATPSLNEAAARAFLDQRFPSFAGLQPKDTPELRWDYINSALVWTYFMPPNSDNVVLSFVDAQTGDEVFTAYAEGIAAGSPKLARLAQTSGLRQLLARMPGGAATLVTLGVALVTVLILLIRRRAKH